MAATYCRFTLIGRVLTEPKRIAYNKKDGTDSMICSFVVGVEPDEDEEAKVFRSMKMFSVKAYGKTAKTAYSSLSKNDYVFIEGTPTSILKRDARMLSEKLYYSELIAQKVVLLSRNIKTAHSREL